MEESIKVGCCFFCMCCLWFGFVSFDCFLLFLKQFHFIQSIPPLPLPSTNVDGGINKVFGCCFFCVCCLCFGLVSFDCCVFVISHVFYFIQSIPPPPLPSTLWMEESIKVGCYFFCMFCICFGFVLTLFWLCFGFVLFDCCILGCFACNFTLFIFFSH